MRVPQLALSTVRAMGYTPRDENARCSPRRDAREQQAADLPDDARRDRRSSRASAIVAQRHGWKIYAYCLMRTTTTSSSRSTSAACPAACASSTRRTRSRSTRGTGGSTTSSASATGVDELDGRRRLLETCRYVVLNPVRAGRPACRELALEQLPSDRRPGAPSVRPARTAKSGALRRQPRVAMRRRSPSS